MKPNKRKSKQAMKELTVDDVADALSVQTPALPNQDGSPLVGTMEAVATANILIGQIAMMSVDVRTGRATVAPSKSDRSGRYPVQPIDINADLLACCKEALAFSEEVEAIMRRRFFPIGGKTIEMQNRISRAIVAAEPKDKS